MAPRFRIVSIIPGMDIAAPLRAESRRGSTSDAPKTRPVRVSTRSMASSTSSHSPSGTSPSRRKCRHASVVIVSPGGTFSPIRHISASCAPLLPSKSRCWRPPSASPPPNPYTQRMSLTRWFWVGGSSLGHQVEESSGRCDVTLPVADAQRASGAWVHPAAQRSLTVRLSPVVTRALIGGRGGRRKVTRRSVGNGQRSAGTACTGPVWASRRSTYEHGTWRETRGCTRSDPKPSMSNLVPSASGRTEICQARWGGPAT